MAMKEDNLDSDHRVWLNARTKRFALDEWWCTNNPGSVGVLHSTDIKYCPFCGEKIDRD